MITVYDQIKLQKFIHIFVKVMNSKIYFKDSHFGIFSLENDVNKKI